ncbi:MAG: hypothetical protein JW818_13140 [Pirellulales bacterium]|nr:hypothetical protein [Pirellulales bacterium]
MNPDEPQHVQPRPRFQYSLRTLLLVVTACGLGFSYWVCTRPVPPSDFFQAACEAQTAGLRDTRLIVGRTLAKVRNDANLQNWRTPDGNDTIRVLSLSGGSGTPRKKNRGIKIAVNIILPQEFHETYYREFRKGWLDLLEETDCTIESDVPLADFKLGFALTYLAKRKKGELRVRCWPGIMSQSEDGRSTEYKDYVLYVFVEVEEEVR